MPNSDQNSDKTLPPSGDSQKAEKYLNRLIDLIADDKLSVSHTDLSKLDPSLLQDHYRMELKDYQVEISHSKQPNSGHDSYICLFTNLQQVREGCTEKVILAYLHLDPTQFHKFKTVADDQLERERRKEEERRFSQAMSKVDEILDELESNNSENKYSPENEFSLLDRDEFKADEKAFEEKFDDIMGPPSPITKNDSEDNSYSKYPSF